MSEVILKGLKKVYDNKVTAVHDVNLDIADKEFIVLVGPSGCGKSTTLRMVAGLEEISDGELYIDGRLVNDVAPKDRDIAMVFQNYALYPHMTVYDNLAFALKLRKTPKAEIDRKVREGAEIIKLRQKLNTTFIYVTHDQTEAMTLADRIVIMKDGYIMQVGTPTECFDMPANLFVAEFIGAPKMNIMKTKLIKENGKYYVTPFGAKIEVTGAKGEELKKRGVEPKEILLGVRPEHITLAKAGEGIPTRLEVNEMMGSELHLHVYTEDETRLIVRVPTINLTREQRENMTFGAALNITFEGKVMHFFDPETEKNLLCD